MGLASVGKAARILAKWSYLTVDLVVTPIPVSNKSSRSFSFACSLASTQKMIPALQTAAFSTRFQFPVECRMRRGRRATLFASRQRRYCPRQAQTFVNPTKYGSGTYYFRGTQGWWLRGAAGLCGKTEPSTIPWNSFSSSTLKHAAGSDFPLRAYFCWSPLVAVFWRSSRCSRAVVTWPGWQWRRQIVAAGYEVVAGGGDVHRN